MTEFSVERSLNVSLRAAAVWVLFAAIVFCLIIGVPMEIATEGAERLHELRDQNRDGQSGFASTFTRAAYVLIAGYLLVCHDRVVRRIRCLLSSNPLPLLLFAAALVMIISASLYTRNSPEAQVKSLVNVYRYAAFTLVMPVLWLDVRNSFRPGYLSVASLAAAGALVYWLLHDTTFDLFSNQRLAFGLVATSAAQQLMATIIIIILAAVGVPGTRWYHHGAYFAAVCLLLFGIAITGTRAAFLIVVLGVVLFIAVRSMTNATRLLMTVTALCATAVALLLSAPAILDAFPYELSSRFERPSVDSGRFEIWSSWLNYFSHHRQDLLFGLRDKPLAQTFDSMKPPHNWLIGIVCQHGIFVLAVLLAFNCTVFHSAWRVVRARGTRGWAVVFVALAAVMLWEQLENSLFLNIGLLSWLWYMLAGCVIFEDAEWQLDSESLEP